MQFLAEPRAHPPFPPQQRLPPFYRTRIFPLSPSPALLPYILVLLPIGVATFLFPRLIVTPTSGSSGHLAANSS